jgi:MFS family permease
MFRLMQPFCLGLGTGSWFALAGTTYITQVFFVHGRGRRAGLWNFAVIVSVNIAPVISARVIVGLGWRWAFWLLAILFGFVLAVAVVCLPESFFDRAAIEAEPTATPVMPTTENSTPEINCEQMLDDKTLTALPAAEDVHTGIVARPVPILKRLLGVGDISYGSPTSAFAAVITPVTFILHPATIWRALMWAVYFSWTIIQGGVADAIWQSPPYNLSTIAVGNVVGITPLIGSPLGCVLGGWCCDWTGERMARSNNGIYEPEFRLPVIIPSLVATIVGAFGLGAAIHNGLSVIATAKFLAILNFAIGLACTGIVSYTNDACRSRAGEAFGIAMVIKSAYAFGLTFVLNDYYTTHGALVFSSTFGGVTVGVTLLTIPMYLFGKKIRACYEAKWSI